MHDVIIVGAGPVGLTLANLLGRRGHRVLVFEKQKAAYALPRAIHFDGEVMRVFQAAGLAEAILPHTHVGIGMLFKDNDDKVLIDWSRAQNIGPMGWYESYRFHQPGVEAALGDGLSRFAGVTVQRQVEVTHVVQSQDHAAVTLNDGSTHKARFVVGCDGAQSSIRQQMGIETEDLGFNEKWVVIDGQLKKPRPDLGDYSVQFCDPENPATYVRGVGDRRRWEIRLPERITGNPTTAEIWALLSRWITPEDMDLERAAVYTFRSAIAQKWQVGRCFIAGDAAHQMPPFMGQGMCAGVRDASNLAWKISAVLGGAALELLDTYGPERKKNVGQFIEMTMRLGRLINQSASGQAPSGQMKSIWPELGEGLGLRDGVAGRLAPQPRIDGKLADDIAEQGFYVLAKEHLRANVPVFVAAQEWLDERDLFAVFVRPDGYALAGVKDAAGLVEILKSHQNITAALRPVSS